MGIIDLVFGRKRSEAVEDQIWFHGLRTTSEIESELTEPGDWLIRLYYTAVNQDVIINVRPVMGGISTYTIKCNAATGKYSLGAIIRFKDNAETRVPLPVTLPQFDSVTALTVHYNSHYMPGDIRLLRAIHRPTWLIKHSSIHYNAETDKLSAGNFGSVYKGNFHKHDGSTVTVAIKVCHQEDDEMTGTSAAKIVEARQSMMHEARLMSTYNHENVISFFGVACDHPPLILVMEFCAGDSLENHLLNIPTIEVVERTLYCFEAARGMHYLHSQECIHSDLASRNCLISAQGIIKIADFGLSKFVNEFTVNAAKLKIPIRWMAPECLGRKPLIIQKSDVWAFGVLMYEIFNNGIMPWPNDKNFKAMAKRIQVADMPSLPPSMPVEIKTITRQCWTIDTNLRPSFSDVYRDLGEYLQTKTPEFPLVANLAINKIKGVNRTFFIRDKTFTTIPKKPKNWLKIGRTAATQEASNCAADSVKPKVTSTKKAVKLLKDVSREKGGDGLEENKKTMKANSVKNSRKKALTRVKDDQDDRDGDRENDRDKDRKHGKHRRRTSDKKSKSRRRRRIGGTKGSTSKTASKDSTEVDGTTSADNSADKKSPAKNEFDIPVLSKDVVEYLQAQPGPSSPPEYGSKKAFEGESKKPNEESKKVPKSLDEEDQIKTVATKCKESDKSDKQTKQDEEKKKKK